VEDPALLDPRQPAQALRIGFTAEWAYRKSIGAAGSCCKGPQAPQAARSCCTRFPEAPVFDHATGAGKQSLACSSPPRVWPHRADVLLQALARLE